MIRTLGYTTIRTTFVSVVALGAMATLAACGAEQPDRADAAVERTGAAVDRTGAAVAKCLAPIAKKAGLPDSEQPQADELEIENLGADRFRVKGTMAIGGTATKSVDFVCEVAPGDAGERRGFKVTHLKVTPAG